MASKHGSSPRADKPPKKSKIATKKLDMEKETDTMETTSHTEDRVVMLLENLTMEVNRISTDITRIDEKITSMDKKLSTLTVQLKVAEGRIANTEDSVNKLTQENEKLKKTVDVALDKISDLENRDRRKNLRIFGFPESSEAGNPVAFLEKELPSILQMQPGSIVIERAHRSLNPTPKAGMRPRPFIINLLRYTTKEKIVVAARNKMDLRWGDHKIMIFQDYSRDIVEKRLKFKEAKKAARGKNLIYFISYPAIFKIKMGDKIHAFTEHKEAEDFITGI